MSTGTEKIIIDFAFKTMTENYNNSVFIYNVQYSVDAVSLNSDHLLNYSLHMHIIQVLSGSQYRLSCKESTDKNKWPQILKYGSSK